MLNNVFISAENFFGKDIQSQSPSEVVHAESGLPERLQQLGNHIPGYNARKGQLDLALAVEKTQIEQSVLVAEAGTGTGKTFAYLIGALDQIIESGKRLIVSTNTIALQTQLIKKDIPVLRKVYGDAINVEIAKGGSRYLCPKRTHDLVNKEQLLQTALDGFETAISTTVREEIIQVWSDFNDQVFNGDLDTLSSQYQGQLQQLVAREHTHCMGKNLCAHAERCPYYIQREAVASANVVITNHALLSSVLADASQALGDISDQTLIVDEAHQFHDVFRDQFLHSIFLAQEFEPHKQLSALSSALSRVFRLQPSLSNHIDPDYLNKLISVCEPQMETLENRWHQLHDFLQRNYKALRGNCQSSFERYEQWCLGFGDTQADFSQLIAGFYGELNEVSKQLAVIGREGILAIERHLKPSDSKLKNAVFNAKRYHQQLSGDVSVALHCLSRFVEHDQLFAMQDRVTAGLVRWVELESNSASFVLHSNKLHVQGEVNDMLFDTFGAVVFTSATIKTLEDFSYFELPLGINQQPRVTRLEVESPFDYSRVAFSTPVQVGDPNSPHHSVKVQEQLKQSLQRHRSVLVLFSSYAQLNQVYNNCDSRLRSLILTQNDLGASSMVEIHRQRIDGGESSVLFGVDSLSEGVDLKGHYLTCVMMAKFPFPSTNTPMLKYASDAITFFGGNVFMELSLPICSRKLIQGVGRLIRTEQDYGEVIIMDSRVFTKRYAVNLINSLPMFRQVGTRQLNRVRR